MSDPAVLVTGASGYVGRFFLARARSSVSILAAPHDVQRVWALPPEMELLTLEEAKRNPRPLKAIVHLAYASGRTRREAEKRNLELARRVINVAHACQARLVHASSIAVWGYSPRRLARPLARLRNRNRTDPYCYAKSSVEIQIVRMCERVHVPLSIVRIGNVIGPASFWANAIAAQAWAPNGPPALSGTSNATSIYNLAELLWNEVDRSEALRITLSTEMAPVRWSEWIAMLRRKPQVTTPSRFPKLGKTWLPPRVSERAKGLAKSSPVLRELVEILPLWAFRALDRWLSAPLCGGEPKPQLPVNEVEAHVFSAPLALPAEGCTAVTAKQTADAVRSWAIWAGYPLEEDGRAT